MDPAVRPVTVPAEVETVAETIFGAVSDAEVRIQRREDTGLGWILHGYFSPEEATQRCVYDAFGGGYYRAALIVRDATGRKVIKQQREFKIPGPYRPPTGELPGMGTRALAPPSPPSLVLPTAAGTVGTMTPGSQSSQVEQALNAKVLEMLGADGRVNWAVVIPTLITAVTPLLTALLDRKAGTDPHLAAQLERMQDKLDALQKPAPGPQTAAANDTFGALKSFLELKELLEGTKEGSGGDPVLSLGGKLIELIAQGQQRGSHGPVPAPLLPAPAPRPAGPPAAPLPLWHQVLLGSRDQLIQAAARGVAADFTADMILQFLPSEVEGVVKELVQSPDAVERIMGAIPELASFPTWLAEVVTELRRSFLEVEK